MSSCPGWDALRRVCSIRALIPTVAPRPNCLVRTVAGWSVAWLSPVVQSINIYKTRSHKIFLIKLQQYILDTLISLVTLLAEVFSLLVAEGTQCKLLGSRKIVTTTMHLDNVITLYTERVQV